MKIDFDYYIFIDYSENLLGYFIIEKEKINDISQKISRFSHFRELKNKSAYLHSINKIIENNNLKGYFLKLKIRSLRETPEIYADLLEFIKNKNTYLIFISIDDKQYSNFERLIKNVDTINNKIIKESQLKKDSLEYRLSLVIDTLLNIERLRYNKGKKVRQSY